MEQIVPSASVGKRTYSVDEIQNMLGICKRKAYDLCKSGDFSIVRIGRTIRVSKSSFDRWLDASQMNGGM